MTKEVLELVSPVAPDPQVRTNGGKRRALLPPRDLRGMRVSLMDNSKSNARKLLSAMQELLVSRHGAARGITILKPVNGPLDRSAVEALEQSSDLVLLASAD
jgi:hypothetical protein